jgi:hypothetical protein
MKERTSSPLIVLLLFALAGIQVPRLVPGKAPETAAKESQGSQEGGGAAEAGADKPAGAPSRQAPRLARNPAWREPLRIYGEYFQVPGIEAMDDAAAIAEVAKKVRGRAAPAVAGGAAPPAGQPVRLRLEFMVALVPDPIDSNLAAQFDQALEGLQSAFADSGYGFNRFWLPWTEQAAAAHDYRRQPGQGSTPCSSSSSAPSRDATWRRRRRPAGSSTGATPRPARPSRPTAGRPRSRTSSPCA